MNVLRRLAALAAFFFPPMTPSANDVIRHNLAMAAIRKAKKQARRASKPW